MRIFNTETPWYKKKKKINLDYGVRVSFALKQATEDDLIHLSENTSMQTTPHSTSVMSHGHADVV